MRVKHILLVAFLLFAFTAKAQNTTFISEKGDSLKNFYLSLNVENLWIAGYHVNWETGEADKPDATHGNHTHCSAFVAAACKRLNIYILRPPDHGQILLANAQYDWLRTKEASDAGWKAITGEGEYAAAQGLANSGYVVLATYKNPDPTVPGHIALVMPANISKQRLDESGPLLIMAGTHNHNYVSLRAGFKSHIQVWPENEILFYYNSNLPAAR